MDSLLVIAPHFPSPAESADGQSNYLTNIVPEVAKHVQVQILSLRFGKQPPSESLNNCTITRIEPPTKMGDVFALYLQPNLGPALASLHESALRVAEKMSTATPVWCHGYETGSVVEELARRGHRVVAVPHYSVGVETIHDFALGDDETRQHAFDSPWATKAGKLTPKHLRPLAVRWASRFGKYGKRLPLPSPIQTQFTKLDLERKMVANASHLVAVGPSFEAELNALYPCTVSRSQHVIAGAPQQLPPAQWPNTMVDEKLRIVMVGRPTGQKGWDYAVEALGRLSEAQASRIEIVLLGGLGTGNGPYSAYSSRVAAAFEQLKPHHVHNLGAVSHPTVLAHLVAADVLLFPSVFEPLGLVLLEGMAAGCCVLSSNAAGPTDVVRPPWGLVVNFDDPESRSQHLHAGIVSFLNLDRNELKERASMAQRAAEKHTWKHCASIHLNALFGR